MLIKHEYANRVKKKDLIHPDLSYEIMGSAFRVFNELGWGHKEIYYQRALISELAKRGMSVKGEQYFDLFYNDQVIGRYRVDIFVNDEIVIELKVRPAMGYVHIKQVVSYLKQANKRLAILIYFTKNGVRYRRIISN